jgi:hypothetical protein
MDGANIKGLVFGREPVVILALVQAIISAAVVFGFNLDTTEQAVLLTLSGAVLTVVARQNVTPTTKVPEVIVGVETPAGDVEPRKLVVEENK